MPSSTGMVGVMGRHRVLIVDDQKPLLLMLERNFRARGIDVCIAHAEEAVQLSITERFVAVLLDVNMPSVNGLDLLSVIRARDPEVPVVMMTAETHIQVAVESLNRGADAFVQKPASPSHLIDVVERVVRQRRAASGTNNNVTKNTAVKLAIDQLYLRWSPVFDADGRAAAYAVDSASRDSVFQTSALLSEHAESTGNGRMLGRATRNLLLAQCRHSASRLDLIVTTSLAQLSEVGDQSVLVALERIADRIVLNLPCTQPLAAEFPQLERRMGIRRRGFRLALSGIGTGHGALATLAAVAPEVVMIDRRLTEDVQRVAPRQHVVAMMVQYCRGTRASLIAEDITSPSQRNCLISLGIQHFQGEYLGATVEELPRS